MGCFPNLCKYNGRLHFPSLILVMVISIFLSSVENLREREIVGSMTPKCSIEVAVSQPLLFFYSEWQIWIKTRWAPSSLKLYPSLYLLYRCNINWLVISTAVGLQSQRYRLRWATWSTSRHSGQGDEEPTSRSAVGRLWWHYSTNQIACNDNNQF